MVGHRPAAVIGHAQATGVACGHPDTKPDGGGTVAAASAVSLVHDLGREGAEKVPAPSCIWRRTATAPSGGPNVVGRSDAVSGTTDNDQPISHFQRGPFPGFLPGPPIGP